MTWHSRFTVYHWTNDEVQGEREGIGKLGGRVGLIGVRHHFLFLLYGLIERLQAGEELIIVYLLFVSVFMRARTAR
jgi:hypothetical protein